jgi:hypothetical protein
LLGRSAFSAVLETRRLVTCGLVRVVAAPDPLPLQRAEPAGPAAGKAPLPSRSGRRTGGTDPTKRNEPARRPEPHPGPLPRRQPGAALSGAFRGGGIAPRQPAADSEHGNSVLPAVSEPDQGLLARVRTALEGLR